MRILGFLLFCAIALWLADLMFNNGRDGNQIWLELNQQAQNADHEIRRWSRRSGRSPIAPMARRANLGERGVAGDRGRF
jgi:hypothetical protein